MPNTYQIFEDDPYLKAFEHVIEARHKRALKLIDEYENNFGGFDKFTKSYLDYGLNVNDSGEVNYREWAPAAKSLSLIGDFNEWDSNKHQLIRDEFGTWSITIPPGPENKPIIPHDSSIKCSLELENGDIVHRIPTWIHRAVQDPTKSITFEGRFWNPPDPYVFKNQRPEKPKDLRIYEAHIGIATQEYGIGTYNEFTSNVLPRIKDLNYNCIQLMGIMEHAYYASFGYQVTNFFAVSSRFGTPEDLKKLIDTAHGLGIYVLLDVIHSHASKNVLDGINQFDGSDHQYFHGGSRGNHDSWESKLFNYSHPEVMRFLLSNIRWWIETYHFDGFRFDAVTSMLYRHHGISRGFSGNYSEYFNEDADEEAISYLYLANYVIHKLYNHSLITIAEDVSGMPTLCRTFEDGGFGFDYRLGLSIPDMWINLLKNERDEEWNMGKICFILTNRRWKEKTVSYTESHDQALVGDKTIAFWLMDHEMYTNMSHLSKMTPTIARGLALHKMIRLITCALGGEAYLNFMGNEFGHPEWLDFPREGNNNSYHYARRQWSLVEDNLLRYQCLYEFDKIMNTIESKYSWLSADDTYITLKHESDKVIVFERAKLVFVFNFHPQKSYTDYSIGLKEPGIYSIVLNTDQKEFAGFSRLDNSYRYEAINEPCCNRPFKLRLYIPCRTAFVLHKITQ